jgi:hypothetical protein
MSKLTARYTFPEEASNNQFARYHYYSGMSKRKYNFTHVKVLIVISSIKCNSVKLYYGAQATISSVTQGT